MLSNSLLNRRYMVLLYAALGVGGSAFSVLAIGAVIFSTAKVLLGRLIIERQAEILSLAAAGLLYLASGLLIIATNPTDAGNYPLALQRLVFLGFLPLFLQLSLVDRQSLKESLETGAALGAVAVAVWALVEFAFAYSGAQFRPFSGRAAGAPGNPGPFATSATILFAVCLLAAVRPARTKRALFVAAAFCAALALLMSGMRTLYPFLVVLPIMLALTQPDARRYLLNPRTIWMFGAAILLAMSIGGFVVISRLANLFAMAEASGLSPTAANSLGQRIALWYCSVDAFREAPLLGLGRSDAILFMRECTNVLVGTPLEYSHFHNALATAAAFGGLVEITATMALLLVPLFWCWHHRQDPDRRYGVTLILSVLVVYGFNGTANLMLGHDIHDALYVHLMAVAFVLLVGNTSAEQDRQAGSQRQEPA